MKGILFFELFIITFTVGLFFFMKKRGYKHVLRKLLILFVGVLLFEIMSEPMWLNIGFDSWAYIYKDITWIITLGWVSIFMVALMLVDSQFGYLHEIKRFWLYLFLIEAITVPIETVLLQTGIRKYADVLAATMTGKMIPLTIVPVEAVYAIPLFAALIICFYKYVNRLCELGAKHGRR